MSTRDIDIDVSAEQVAEMTALGFWRQEADGVLVLTDEGNAWVREWLAERIKEATA